MGKRGYIFYIFLFFTGMFFSILGISNAQQCTSPYTNRVCPPDGLTPTFCFWDYVKDGIINQSLSNPICSFITPNTLQAPDTMANVSAGFDETVKLGNNLMDFDQVNKPIDTTYCDPSKVNGGVVSWIHLRKDVYPGIITSMRTTVYYYQKKKWQCKGFCVWRIYAYDLSSNSIDMGINLDGLGNYWVDFPVFPQSSVCIGEDDAGNPVFVNYEVLNLTFICFRLAEAGRPNVDLRLCVYDDSKKGTQLELQEIELEYSVIAPTSTPTPTLTSTFTATRTVTATSTPSSTFTLTPTSSPTLTPSNTPTLTPVNTWTPTPTVTSFSTHTATPTITPTPTATLGITLTVEFTASNSPIVPTGNRFPYIIIVLFLVIATWMIGILLLNYYHKNTTAPRT